MTVLCEALVPATAPGGGIIMIGDQVKYSGPPNWKFRPLDAEYLAEWEELAEDPERVTSCIERVPGSLQQPRAGGPETIEYRLRDVAEDA